MLRQKEGLLHKLYSSSEAFNEEIAGLLQGRFQKHPQSLTKRLVLYLMVVFGAVWGVPWMESAAQGVKELGVDSQAVLILVRVGIVIAVGVDGVWIMLTIHAMMFPQHQTKLKLRKAYRHLWKVLLASVVLAVVSCIPGVYAAYLYNTGAEQYLAIITFFGNLGLATFGFFTVLFELTKRVMQPKDEPSTASYQARIQEMYHTVICNQDNETEPIVPATVLTYTDFVRYLEEQSGNYYREDFGAVTQSLLMVLPLVFAIVVASSQSLIDVVLTTDFFTQRLHWDEALSIGLACVFAIPNLIVSFLSSKEVASKILSTLLCRKKYQYLEHFHKKLTVLVAFVSLLVSIAAPTSACYIVYSSLNEVHHTVAVASAISLLLARLCFSNYTCRVLFSKLLIALMRRRRTIEEANLQQIFLVVEKVHPSNYLLVVTRTDNNEELPPMAIAV